MSKTELTFDVQEGTDWHGTEKRRLSFCHFCHFVIPVIPVISGLGGGLWRRADI